MQSGRQVIRAGPDLKLPFSPAIRSGNFIYVSGTLATNASGQLAGGDIRAQTKLVLNNIAAVLKAANSSLERAASVTVYIRNAADFPAMNDAYREYWPKDPPVRTTVAANLIMPEALVEISLIAVGAGAERQVIHPAGWMKPTSPYSYGVRSGDTLFLAGLLSRNARDNTAIPGDMATQTKAVMENAGEILKAGGMSFADVAAARVYITDTAQFQNMNSSYRAYFPKDPPARATVRTGLTSPDALVEIALTAVKGARGAVHPPNPDGSLAQPNPNLSPAIRVGNRLFLSGMLGNEPGNKGDAGAQTTVVLSRIARTLMAAGFGWNDVLDGTVYLTDLKNFAAMNQAYQKIFQADFPARATVETGLVSPDALVEIMFLASK
jgi:enamine deaminase RidA (YjgF/YER057c/UK114 family)